MSRGVEDGFLTLERRVFLSAAVSLSAGVLYARSTDAAPVALTVAYADASRATIRVTAGGRPLGKLFRASRVTRVILAGGGGDDRLRALSTFAPFDKPLLILGNAGDDTIVGGTAADALVGGAGDDVLSGGKGADLLLGGGGADTLAVAPGPTTSTAASAPTTPTPAPATTRSSASTAPTRSSAAQATTR